jgi:hypothetical protein
VLSHRKEPAVLAGAQNLPLNNIFNNLNSNQNFNFLTFFSMHMSPPHVGSGGYQMYPPMSGGSGRGSRKMDMIMRTTVKSNNSNNSWQPPGYHGQQHYQPLYPAGG